MTTHQLERRLNTMVGPIAKQLTVIAERSEMWRQRALAAERKLQRVLRALELPTHMVERTDPVPTVKRKKLHWSKRPENAAKARRWRRNQAKAQQLRAREGNGHDTAAA